MDGHRQGIWTTAESGHSWVRLPKAPAGMLRVWFLDRKHGFAAGLKKRVFETTDGGESWALLDILKEVQGTVAFTTFGEIAFSGDKGIISGWNIPPRRGGPDWMEPENAARRQQVPHLQRPARRLSMAVRSGSRASLRVRRDHAPEPHPAGHRPGLVEFKDMFDIPATWSGSTCTRERASALSMPKIAPSPMFTCSPARTPPYRGL